MTLLRVRMPNQARSAWPTNGAPGRSAADEVTTVYRHKWRRIPAIGGRTSAGPRDSRPSDGRRSSAVGRLVQRERSKRGAPAGAYVTYTTPVRRRLHARCCRRASRRERLTSTEGSLSKTTTTGKDRVRTGSCGALQPPAEAAQIS